MNGACRSWGYDETASIHTSLLSISFCITLLILSLVNSGTCPYKRNSALVKAALTTSNASLLSPGGIKEPKSVSRPVR